LLGLVARLHRQKGLGDLLAAVAWVRERVPDVRLLLIGEGELRDELEAQARALGLSGAVIFAGIRTDVAEIVAALDIFVLPSLWEGTSNAVLEAMAAGLPIVATAVGGTPEVVVDGVTGLLVPPRDPSALAGALVTLLQDADLRHRMGRAGRERVKQYFSLERMVRRTEALYEELLSLC
jgi:glycosyltransferase involved in cell wall biosynthesis